VAGLLRIDIEAFAGRKQLIKAFRGRKQLRTATPDPDTPVMTSDGRRVVHERDAGSN